ncbi:MAG: hypothetical protein K2Q06_09455, partial [Parvularculaceae bacterium]|nr:hypothetical protein [Parvularculaceae bacterium]
AAATPGPRWRGVLDAVAGWIVEGGVLTISAAPAAPVPFASLGREPAADFAETVNLTATHERPASKKP